MTSKKKRVMGFDFKRYFQKVKFILGRKYHRFCRRLKNETYSAEQEALFQKIQVGEVVYAEMPFSDSVLFEIPEGHRMRPYFVVKKNEHSLMAYPSSHKRPKKEKAWKTFKLFHTRNEQVFRYSKEKKNYTDSFFSLSRYYELPIDRLQYLFMQPVKGEAERLERQLHILKNHGKNVCLMDILIPFHDGDLIENEGTLYFVYTVDNQNLYTHPVTTKEAFPESIAVKFGFQYHRIDWRTQRLFHRSDTLSLVDACTFETLKEFERRKKAKKVAQKIQSKESIKMELFYKFPVGQVFYLPFAEDEVIYVCHTKKRAYAIFNRDLKKGIYHIRRFDELPYAKKLDKILSFEELEAILTNLLISDDFEGLMQIYTHIFENLEKSKKTVDKGDMK